MHQNEHAQPMEQVVPEGVKIQANDIEDFLCGPESVHDTSRPEEGQQAGNIILIVRDRDSETRYGNAHESRIRIYQKNAYYLSSFIEGRPITREQIMAMLELTAEVSRVAYERTQRKNGYTGQVPNAMSRFWQKMDRLQLVTHLFDQHPQHDVVADAAVIQHASGDQEPAEALSEVMVKALLKYRSTLESYYEGDQLVQLLYDAVPSEAYDTFTDIQPLSDIFDRLAAAHPKSSLIYQARKEMDAFVKHSGTPVVPPLARDAR